MDLDESTVIDPVKMFQIENDERIKFSEMLEIIYSLQRGNSVLSIGIFWIGHSMSFNETYEDKEELEDAKCLVEEIGIDDSKYNHHFEFTADGEVICINEYACHIADAGKLTHVI